jgi:hypothetical protein
MPEQGDPRNPRNESERLAQRSQLNRIEFLRTELQTCFTLAGVAEAEQSLHDPEHAAKSLAHAEKGYATMLRFMTDPKHAQHISEREYAELTAGMERLRAQLDKLAQK